jgi:hypothetical protein
MVLQAPPAGSSWDDRPFLWGWMSDKDNVKVELPGHKRPIAADWERIRGQPTRRTWSITYRDASPLPVPGQPFTIVITNALRGKQPPEVIALSNVVLGDVWVLGQDLRRGVAIPDRELVAVSASLNRRLRYLRTNTLDWSTNLSGAVPGGWRQWDDAAPDLTNLANITCYFCRNLLEQNGRQPFGIVVLPQDELTTLCTDSAETFARAPALNLAWSCATNAAAQAARDCAPLLKEYSERLLQLRREGKILLPPAEAILPPRCVHTDRFSNMPISIRGGIR